MDQALHHLKHPPRDRLMSRLRQAFHDFGYEQATMVGLAKACDVTRRTLYNHFSDKEKAFRGVLRWQHPIQIEAGLAAGAQVLAQGGSALDALVAVVDERYGAARRELARSPHAIEINYTAFRRCRDVMVESAVAFQARLAGFVAELCANGLLRLRPGISPEDLAQLLADGARGVNQSLPATDDLTGRYRQMFRAILHGCTDASPSSGARVGRKAPQRVRG